MCNLSEGIEAAAIAKAEEKFNSILSEKDKAINEKDEEISRLKKLLAEANNR